MEIVQTVVRNTTVVLTVNVTDADGLPVAPASYTWTVRTPDGAASTYTSTDPECANPSAGKYTLAVSCTAPGIWQVNFQSSAPAYSSSQAVRVMGKWE